MPPGAFDFFVLRFAASTDGKGWILVLVVVTHSRPPRVVVAPGWEDGLKATDREYLNELIDDWLATPPENTEPLLEELRELSLGPLRTILAGSTTPEEIENLVERVLLGQFEAN